MPDSVPLVRILVLLNKYCAVLMAVESWHDRFIEYCVIQHVIARQIYLTPQRRNQRRQIYITYNKEVIEKWFQTSNCANVHNAAMLLRLPLWREHCQAVINIYYSLKRLAQEILCCCCKCVGVNATECVWNFVDDTEIKLLNVGS